MTSKTLPSSVEDRPGADGIIGAADAAKAAPDGYTWFLTTNTTHSVNPYIHKTLPYDPNKDFVPIGLLGETAPALLTSGTNAVATVKDVVELVKSKPGELNFAATNTSSLAAAQMLEQRTGGKVVIVKYKSAPEALTDTMSGTMQYFFGDLASGGALARAGKLKALAVLSDRRLPGLRSGADHGRGRISRNGNPDLDRNVRAQGNACRTGRAHQPRGCRGPGQTGIHRRAGDGAR